MSSNKPQYWCWENTLNLWLDRQKLFLYSLNQGHELQLHTLQWMQASQDLALANHRTRRIYP